MGLDTTHDCWHGPYSAFMRWREHLHDLLSPDRNVSLETAWSIGLYADQSVPINVLMNHSDCDGDIPTAMCAPIADALTALLEKMPPRAVYDTMRPATERFISGLRRAADACEDVEFQ